MQRTLIPWTDDTHNFWIGCAPVSDGCENCYAKALMELRYGKAVYRQGAPRLLKADFDGLLAEAARKPWTCRSCNTRLTAPLGAPGGYMCPSCGGSMRRRRVFTLSLGDFWDREVEPAWTYRALRSIWQRPELDFLILTKRPEEVRARLDWAGKQAVKDAATGTIADEKFYYWIAEWSQGKPPRNIWLGITGETGALLRDRWQAISQIPAAQYFLSLEPLLEDVSEPLGRVLRQAKRDKKKVWTILGGESGVNARKCWTWWFERSAVVCRELQSPVYVKQLGRYCLTTLPHAEHWPEGTRFDRDIAAREFNGKRVRLGHPKGGDPGEWPLSLQIREEPLAEDEEDDLVC